MKKLILIISFLICLNGYSQMGMFHSNNYQSQKLEFKTYADSNNLFYLDLNNNSSLTTIILNESNNRLGEFRIYFNSNLDTITNLFLNDSIFEVNSCDVWFYNNNWDSSIVDYTLRVLDKITGDSYDNRTIQIHGNNDAPTDGTFTGYDGEQAVINLQNKGFTVITSSFDWLLILLLMLLKINNNKIKD